MFQFYNLIPSLTARENVALVTDISSAPMSAEEALELVGLGARRASLSRRSSPAASSSAWPSPAPSPSGPACCCATSPPARWTFRTGIVVLEAIARVNAELGTTTVVITHNAAIAAMADRVVRLADGSVASIEERHGTKLAAKDLSW